MPKLNRLALERLRTERIPTVRYLPIVSKALSAHKIG